MKSFGYSILLLVALVGATHTQSLDGLYHPNFGNGERWQCTRDALGFDGGAMALKGDELFGVETTCTLTNRKSLAGDQLTSYDADCWSEGTQFSELFYLSPYYAGVLVANSESIRDWRSCSRITNEYDPEFLVSKDSFLGVSIFDERFTTAGLIDVYFYSRCLCRGTILTGSVELSDLGCELLRSIQERLIALGMAFDESEQEWVDDTDKAQSDDKGLALPANRLVANYRYYNGKCRGGSGDQLATHAACGARDYVLYELSKVGICLSKSDQASFEMEFHSCGAGSNRVTTPPGFIDY